MKTSSSLFLAASLLAAPTVVAQSVSQIQQPTTFTSIVTPAHDIAVTPNGRFSVATHGAGVELIDMNPAAGTNPVVASDPGPGTPMQSLQVYMSSSVKVTNTRAIVVGITGAVSIYDISTGALTPMSMFTPSMPPGALARGLTLTPDGTRAVVVYSNAPTLVFNMATAGAPIATLTGAGAGYTGMPSANPVEATNTHAVAVGNRGGIRVYDLGTIIADITPPAVAALANEDYYDVAISPDGMTAVAVSDNNSPSSDTQIIALRAGNPSNIAAYVGAFSGPGSADRFVATASGPPVRAGLLHDMVAVSNSSAIVIGINPFGTTITGQAHVIDLSTSTPTRTTFPVSGVLHDLTYNESGTMALVHASGEVQVYDVTAPATPTVTSLSSPGFGVIGRLNANEQPYTYRILNSVSVQNGRAIVIGNNATLFGVQSANAMIYDVSDPTIPPSLIQTNASANPGLAPALREVQLTPNGAIAGVLGSGNASYIRMSDGDLNPNNTQSCATKYLEENVRSIGISNARMISIGNSHTFFGGPETPPYYSLDAICQLPFSQGTALPNSSGVATTLSHTGNTSIAQNNFSLVASGLPSNGGSTSTFGVFIYSFGIMDPVPLFDGLLYVQQPLYRLGTIPLNADPFTFQVDQTMLPAAGTIAPGVEVHFQLWYRDGASPNGANLSNVYTVCFGM